VFHFWGENEPILTFGAVPNESGDSVTIRISYPAVNGDPTVLAVD
jgi:hypothetical protein